MVGREEGWAAWATPGSMLMSSALSPGSSEAPESTAVGRFLSLVEARDWDGAIALAVDHWQEMLDPDRFDLLVEGLRAVPPETYIDDVRLALAAGTIFLTWGLPDEADARFDAETVRSDPAARATAAALRAHATWWTTGADEALVLLDQVRTDLEETPGMELVLTPGFEPMTTGRSMLAVSRARALALQGEVGRAHSILSDLFEGHGSDVVRDSVSAWSTKAWVAALAGDVGRACEAADTAFSLAQPDGWDLTPALAPARLSRALVAAYRGEPSGTINLVADAAEVATRAGAMVLAQVCRATAVMCGHAEALTEAGERSSLGPVPLVDDLERAWRHRSAARCGDLDGAARLLTQVPSNELTLREAEPDHVELSARERQIIALLDGPLTVNEISTEIYLSSHTTKWYVARIYRKLGTRSRVDAVEQARKLGFVGPPSPPASGVGPGAGPVEGL